MRKKGLIIFAIIFLSLIIFNADVCLAVLNTPKALIVEITEITPISANLRWIWNSGGEGTIEHFRIKYRRIQSSELDWTEPDDLPQKKSTNYQVGGLWPNRDYEWKIMAEAKNPIYNSSYSDVIKFTTDVITQQEEPENGNGNGGWNFQDIELKNPLNQDSLWDAINAVLNFFIIASFAIAPILIIYAAFLMIFAAGDATKISKAKDIIFWTVIALAVILFAKGLPSVIKGAFGG